MKKITNTTEKRLAAIKETDSRYWLAKTLLKAINIHRNIADNITDGYGTEKDYTDFYDEFGVSIFENRVGIKKTYYTPADTLKDNFENIPRTGDNIEYTRLMTGCTHIQIKDLNSFVREMFTS